ncbi:hypothetical protein TB2_021867 [Malus domestica]
MMNRSGHGPGLHSRVIDRVMDRVNNARLEKALPVCEDLFEDMIDQLNDSPTFANNTTRNFNLSHPVIRSCGHKHSGFPLETSLVFFKT